MQHLAAARITEPDVIELQERGACVRGFIGCGGQHRHVRFEREHR